MSGMNYIEIGVCAVLLLFLLRKEMRAGRPRLGWRMAATTVAVAALLGLILPLSYRRRVSEAPVAGVHGGPPAEGIVQADWPRALYTGERMVVRGRWRGRSGPVKLLLMGMGAVEDSANVDGEFSLGAVPPQTGKAVYRLVAVRGRDTIEQEDIPVEVGRGQPMKILVLAATPDFENVFLVNWLARNDQQVAVRTMVSRDRYQTSFVNMKPRPLERVTRVLLDGFDLVIADETVWDAERAVLLQAVEEEGLGLIVRTDSLSRTMAGGKLMGLGKVFYTASDTTYVRVMAGQTAGYASYWAGLLRLVGRPGGPAVKWSWEPGEPRVGDEVELSVQTTGTAPQGIVAQGGRTASVYLAEDEVLGFRWRGRYWPDAEAWVAVNDSNWMYVWPRGSWPAMDQAERKIGKKASVGEEQAPVPKNWIYTTFLLSIFFLWVERKFF
jgi:hypothetical protein